MTDWPRIPTYSDSENNVFHPVFEFALQVVLQERKIKDVEIIRQFPTDSGPADLVLRRKSTGKVIFPIEMKRTQSDVRGMGRRQGRDYQHNIASFAETSFYCVSNLELTEFFNADPNRQTTQSQQITLSTIQDALLESGHDEDIKKILIQVVNEIFDIVFNGNKFSYVVGLRNFEHCLRSTIRHNGLWHEGILPFCFEYIRGSKRLVERTRHWKTAAAYKQNPQRLIDLGEKIDFKLIFSPPLSRKDFFDTPVLSDAYNSGKSFGSGDDFSALVGDILFSPQDGIVETDFDLARLLAIASKHEAGDLSTEDEILDPGAGSGRLLAAMIQEELPSINPSRVLAVEQEKRFSEALSLRLGLQFGASLSPTNSPKIRICPFQSLDSSSFTNVKIALVNPPFLSGVSSAKIKGELLSRIKGISGRSSIVGNGQIGYEAVFMELLWHMLPAGCTIACIFPYQVISRLSEETAILRKFLAEQFALTTVITYPRDKIFKTVVKKTLIFIGRKGVASNGVRVIDIQIPVPDLDFHRFREHLQNGTECYGITDTVVCREDLLADINTGWHRSIGIGARVIDFIQNTIGRERTIVDFEDKIRRGTMGNSGNTSLTVMTPQNLHKYVPRRWLVGAINNAKNLPKVINNLSAPDVSFVPPQDAHGKHGIEYERLKNLVSEYVKEADGKFSTKKQKTSPKTEQTIIGDILKDQQNPAVNAILIPRACREIAKIAIVDGDPILVSTNFLIIGIDDNVTRILMASWVKSIFGQLQLELFSTSQEGMRKTEKNGILNIAYPAFECISKDDEQELIHLFSQEDFLDLSAVVARDSDLIWAKILGAASPKEMVDEVVSLLQMEYDNRVQ